MSELPRSAPGAYPSVRARVPRVIAATHAGTQPVGRAGAKLERRTGPAPPRQTCAESAMRPAHGESMRGTAR